MRKSSASINLGSGAEGLRHCKLLIPPKHEVYIKNARSDKVILLIVGLAVWINCGGWRQEITSELLKALTAGG